MKVRLVTRVTIAANCADVFKYLSNLDHHFLWNPHLRSLSPVTTLKLGLTYKSTSLLLGVKVRAINVVTKFLLDKELEVKNRSGALHYTVNFHLSPKDKKTLLTCTTTVSSDSHAFAFATPVLSLLAKRELQSDLRALKIAVEQQLES